MSIINADVKRVLGSRSSFHGDRLKDRMFGYATDTRELVVRSDGIYHFIGGYSRQEFENIINGKVNVSDFLNHINDTHVHVSTDDRENWDGKMDPLNRSVSTDDSETGTVTDTGDDIAIPVQVTTEDGVGNEQQLEAGIHSLRAATQRILDNLANIFPRVDTSEVNINTINVTINRLDTSVSALNGALIYIGQIDLKTEDITQDALNLRAIELRGEPVGLGYVLIDNNENDWWYDGKTWINIGYFTITKATNTQLGVVKGSTNNLMGAINSEGEISINGLSQALSNIPAAANLGVTTSAFGQAIQHGSASTFARSDHRHPLPSLPATMPPSAHNHDASNINSGILPMIRGGTGRNNEPLLMTHLGCSNTRKGILQSLSNTDEGNLPGVTGTLSVSHGGTGATTTGSAREALGITPENIGALPTSAHPHSTYNRASAVLSGANVFSNIVVSSGIVTNIATRALTPANIGALPVSGGTMTGRITGPVNFSGAWRDALNSRAALFVPMATQNSDAAYGVVAWRTGHGDAYGIACHNDLNWTGLTYQSNANVNAANNTTVQIARFDKGIITEPWTSDIRMVPLGTARATDTEIVGAWRLSVSGNNLLIQRWNGTSWVTRHTFTA